MSWWVFTSASESLRRRQALKFSKHVHRALCVQHTEYSCNVMNIAYWSHQVWLCPSNYCCCTCPNIADCSVDCAQFARKLFRFLSQCSTLGWTKMRIHRARHKVSGKCSHSRRPTTRRATWNWFLHPALHFKQFSKWNFGINRKLNEGNYPAQRMWCGAWKYKHLTNWRRMVVRASMHQCISARTSMEHM